MDIDFADNGGLLRTAAILTHVRSKITPINEDPFESRFTCTALNLANLLSVKQHPAESRRIMNLMEAPICAAAVARLRSKGWRVGCEVRIGYRPVDAAAILDDKVLALEAKISLNEKLRHQLKRLTRRADYVLGVIGSSPRAEGINWCVKHKVGLWIVTAGPLIELLPFRQLRPNNRYRNDVIKRLERWDETIVGGVPNRLGIGVAQDVQRRVDQYRVAHPNATWKEIYENVPSHYDSFKNMYSSLRSNAERLASRKRDPLVTT